MALEFAVGFVAAWWHEDARGQRAWVVPEETITWLRGLLRNISIDPDTTNIGPTGTAAAFILDRMLDAARADPGTRRNVMYFPGTRLHPSEYVWATGGTALVDGNAIAGREFVRRVHGRGRIFETNVELDPYGYESAINHTRPRPARTDEPSAVRRRVGETYRPDHRPVPHARRTGDNGGGLHDTGNNERGPPVGYDVHPRHGARVHLHHYTGPTYE